MANHMQLIRIVIFFLGASLSACTSVIDFNGAPPAPQVPVRDVKGEWVKSHIKESEPEPEIDGANMGQLPYSDIFPFATIGNTWIYSATYVGAHSVRPLLEVHPDEGYDKFYDAMTSIPVSATFMITDQVVSVQQLDTVWGAEIQRHFKLVDISPELIEKAPTAILRSEFLSPVDRYDGGLSGKNMNEFHMPSDFTYSYVITDSNVYKQGPLDLANIKARRGGKYSAFRYPIVFKLPFDTDDNCWFPGTGEGGGLPCEGSRDAHYTITDGPFDVQLSVGTFSSCHNVNVSGFRVSGEQVVFCEGIGPVKYHWRYNSMRNCCIDPGTGFFYPLENHWQLIHYSINGESASAQAEFNKLRQKRFISPLSAVLDTRDDPIAVEESIHLQRFANGSKWLVGIRLEPHDEAQNISQGNEFWIVDDESRTAVRFARKVRHPHTALLSPNQTSIIFTDGTDLADMDCTDLDIAIIRSFGQADEEQLKLADFDGLPTTDCTIYPWDSRFRSWLPNVSQPDSIYTYDKLYEIAYRWLNENEIEIILARLGHIEDGVRVGRYRLDLTTRQARFVEVLFVDELKE